MRRIVAAALISGVLSGCAASSSIEPASGNAPAIDSSKSGAVEVSSALPDKSETVAALKTAITAQLVNKRVFKSLTADSSSDYLLRVEIVDVSQVNQATRILLGALAGQSELTANCSVVERKNNKVIGSMVAKGASSGGHIFAGTTQETIDMVATKIADYLLANRKL